MLVNVFESHVKADKSSHFVINLYCLPRNFRARGTNQIACKALFTSQVYVNFCYFDCCHRKVLVPRVFILHKSCALVLSFLKGEL